MCYIIIKYHETIQQTIHQTIHQQCDLRKKKTKHPQFHKRNGWYQWYIPSIYSQMFIKSSPEIGGIFQPANYSITRG